MKNSLKFLSIIIISVLALNSKTDSQMDSVILDIKENISYQYKITVNFEYGVNLSPTAHKNIYTIMNQCRLVREK